ncbi:MAG: MFS transporter, partial [Pseudomonas chlororaphis]
MAGPVTSESGKHLSRGIPRTVWALGFVSLFMDVSSELVHSLLPLYMVGTLGISML